MVHPANQLASRKKNVIPIAPVAAAACLLSTFTHAAAPPACIPQQVTSGQLKEIGQRFMTVNAQDRHYEAVQILTAAFTQAWPCSTPRTR
jgi:hypothetical protein